MMELLGAAAKSLAGVHKYIKTISEELTRIREILERDRLDRAIAEDDKK